MNAYTHMDLVSLTMKELRGIRNKPARLPLKTLEAAKEAVDHYSHMNAYKVSPANHFVAFDNAREALEAAIPAMTKYIRDNPLHELDAETKPQRLAGKVRANLRFALYSLMNDWERFQPPSGNGRNK